MIGSPFRMAMAAAVAALLLASSWAGAARARDYGQLCEGGKNLASGKYAACVLRAERNLVLNGDSTKYASALATCSVKLQVLWGKLQTKATGHGTACPSMDDDADIMGFLDSCSQSVADALAGGSLPSDPGSCTTDLATCNDDLDVCNADLGTCDTSLATCSSDLGTCTGNLDTCNTDLGTAQGDLSACNGNLSTCTTDLGTCNTDLGTAQGDLSACSGNLSTCTTDLGACNTDLGTCTGDLDGCNTDLTTAQGDLSTCNGDLSTCTGDLDTCTTDLGTCTTDLGTCTGDLATAQADLDTCTADLEACLASPARPLKTGQSICYDSAGTVVPCAGTGQDGQYKTGVVRSYTDNGDGTITDDSTGLMWEKLSLDATVHNRDATYTWDDAFSVKIAALNSGAFAGYTDWRLPNRFELDTLVDLGKSSPCIGNAFNVSCGGSCSVLSCSCTRSNFYWSSTTLMTTPANAWIVGFMTGNSSTNAKSSLYYVRAVRGGS